MRHDAVLFRLLLTMTPPLSQCRCYLPFFVSCPLSQTLSHSVSSSHKHASNSFSLCLGQKIQGSREDALGVRSKKVKITLQTRHRAFIRQPAHHLSSLPAQSLLMHRASRLSHYPPAGRSCPHSMLRPEDHIWGGETLCCKTERGGRAVGC